MTPQKTDEVEPVAEPVERIGLPNALKKLNDEELKQYLVDLLRTRDEQRAA